MTKHELAEEMRERQRAWGKHPKPEILDMLTDQQMIDSYITCAGCKERMAAVEEVDQAIRLSTCFDEFWWYVTPVRVHHHHHQAQHQGFAA